MKITREDWDRVWHRYRKWKSKLKRPVQHWHHELKIERLVAEILEVKSKLKSTLTGRMNEGGE